MIPEVRTLRKSMRSIMWYARLLGIKCDEVRSNAVDARTGIQKAIISTSGISEEIPTRLKCLLDSRTGHRQLIHQAESALLPLIHNPAAIYHVHGANHLGKVQVKAPSVHPTRVGLMSAEPPAVLLSPVHSHTRGANGSPPFTASETAGSSPHAWG